MSKPIRVAVIGCGKAGRAHAHWYRSDSRSTVVAVWDRTKSTADAIAAEIGCRALDTWDELVGDPEVDLVSLCGPSSSRAEQAVRFLASGTPVLCEKPMARTVRECDEMIAASLAGNASLYCVFNMRFHPVAEAVREALSSIGRIVAADIAYTQHRGDVTWRHKLDQGGGVLKEQAVHAFDLLHLWLGRVRDVSGETLIVHPDRETEDHAEVLLRFDSGATARVYASYCDPRPEMMTGALVGLGGRIEFVLSPYDPARNVVSLTTSTGTTGASLRRADSDPVYPGLMDATNRLIGFVLDRVEDGRPAWIDGAAGRAALEVVAAAYASDQRHEKISLPLAVPEAFASGWVPRRADGGRVGR